MSPTHQAELAALLQLRLLPRIGDLAVARLLVRFGSARAALDRGATAAREVAGPAAARAWKEGAGEARDQARRILDAARAAGTHVLGRGLPGYPPVLMHLADPPPVLFVQGRMELLACERVAVVGSRRATAGGRRFAGDLAQTLSRHGIPVVSGLALGIDAAAHRGALDGPGSTVAVLASGLDRVHPGSHRRLQERIRSQGLLVSEFPPGEEARSYHFPRRNRILAALARDVVVVEAGARSGALITVEHALDLGREVWAVPGAVEYEQARGVNTLLREGASLLTDPAELLASWRRAGVPLPASDDETGGGSFEDPLGILDHLGARPVATEALARSSGTAPGTLLRALSELELQGGVVREPDGWRLARPTREASPILARVVQRFAQRSEGAGGTS